MPTDTVCWHCGEPLAEIEESFQEVAKPVSDRKQEGAGESPLVYGVMTAFIIVAAVIVMFLLGNRPRVQIGLGTIVPGSWQSVSPEDLSFYVNLPSDWQAWDGSDRDLADEFKEVLSRNSRFLAGTQPLGAEVADMQVTFVALDEGSGTDAGEFFLVVGLSRRLAGLTYEEAGQFLSQSDYAVRRVEYIDDFDRSHLSIDVEVQADGIDEGILRCQQQFIRGDSESMLASLCGPRRFYLNRQFEISKILDSFQGFPD